MIQNDEKYDSYGDELRLLISDSLNKTVKFLIQKLYDKKLFRNLKFNHYVHFSHLKAL